jgi:hypothetical protein
MLHSLRLAFSLRNRFEEQAGLLGKSSFAFIAFVAFAGNSVRIETPRPKPDGQIAVA